MDGGFQGKRALVTGAGKGIGRAVALKLASLGAQVVGLSRTQADLDSLKAECPSIEVLLLDITNWDTAREAVEKLGHVDLLVNNAGITNWSSFLEITREELDNVLDINFRAAFNISQIAARSMVAKGTGGAIVNVSSVAGMRAIPNHTAYCTAKAALDMLSLTLALELGPHKIRVNSINPTVVMTTLGKKGWSDPVKKAKGLANIPLGRFAEEEDVVNAIVFLLSDKASMINGITMPLDGGMIVSCV